MNSNEASTKRDVYCVMCFSKFSSKYPELIPRNLNCTHIYCTGNLLTMLSNSCCLNSSSYLSNHLYEIYSKLWWGFRSIQIRQWRKSEIAHFPCLIDTSYRNFEFCHSLADDLTTISLQNLLLIPRCEKLKLFPSNQSVCYSVSRTL